MSPTGIQSSDKISTQWCQRHVTHRRTELRQDIDPDGVNLNKVSGVRRCGGLEGKCKSADLIQDVQLFKLFGPDTCKSYIVPLHSRI